MTRKIVAVIASLLVAGGSATAFAKARFGTFCQEEFQVNPATGKRWRDTLSESWDRCAWFNDELDDTDTKVYYWTMHGTAWNFMDSGDQAALEDVDLVFINTHSGAWLSTDTQVFKSNPPGNGVVAAGTWAMWDVESRGYSNDLYLGNEGYGLSIMANYSCELLKTSDNHIFDRWGRAFKGGLKIVLGSHGNLSSGVTTDECGEDFADNMQSGDTLKTAWKDALSDWDADQDVAVTASGRDCNECHTRRDGMKWQNFTSGFGRLRDGNVSCLCTTSWDNL